SAGRASVRLRSDLPGSPSQESQENVRLLARNQLVAPMAGPVRIPGRGPRKNACQRRGGAVG
ncbi:hypothetical protein RZS08_63240, partial [Arthrospira platensis SPKY1]|nr:hypothetical protein [Arthrospira platensis SPKY1]